ncbi:hypothetical protein DXG01_002328 [Tephrocybe rancida]|nr:hypothetical protein DXG01_002328 [Tephrocybe rancida]
MPWKAFPEFAVKNRLRAIGWCPDIAPPGPKLNFKELSTKILWEMVEARIAAMNSPDEDHDIIQIVPWTKEEKQFDVKDQAMAPLVIDSNNNALVVVQDSKNYKQSLGKQKATSRATEDLDEETSDEDSPSPPARPAPAVHNAHPPVATRTGPPPLPPQSTRPVIPSRGPRPVPPMMATSAQPQAISRTTGRHVKKRKIGDHEEMSPRITLPLPRRRGLPEVKTMSAQDWAVVVAGEYKDYCKQELQEKLEDPMEHAQLLEPMVEWYKEWYNDLIDEKKVDGTFHKIIAKMRDEFMHSAQLASQYHDLHYFGFIMNLHPDQMGHTGSMMWGKKQKKIILEEMTEWESLLRVSDIELRGSKVVDNPYSMFVAKLKKHNNICNDKWSLFTEWLWLDIGHTLFKRRWDLDVCLAMKMSWTDWPKYAYMHKLCLINWPVKAVSPGQTDEKYNIKKKSNGVPQQCLTNSNAKQREDPESDDPACIRIISWDDEDLELDPKDNDYSNIPLVLNSEQYSVLCVEDCETYQQAKKTGDFDISKKKKKRRTLKDKLTPTLYEHRKFLLKNVNFIDLDDPDPVPVPKPPTHAKQACANDDEWEHTHQKKSRVDNNIPGPSKLKKMCELTAVAGPNKPKSAGPSKQFEMTPEMIAAVAQMVMAMQSGDDNMIQHDA